MYLLCYFTLIIRLPPYYSILAQGTSPYCQSAPLYLFRSLLPSPMVSQVTPEPRTRGVRIKPNHRPSKAKWIASWPDVLLLINLTLLDVVIAQRLWLHKKGYHHGKPFYRGDMPTYKVYLYYWSDPCAPDWTGWWLAPTLGGDKFWARNEPGPRPPRYGWKEPRMEPTPYYVPSTAEILRLEEASN